MIIKFNCTDNDLFKDILNMEFEDRDYALTAFLSAGFYGYINFLINENDRTNEITHQN